MIIIEKFIFISLLIKLKDKFPKPYSLEDDIIYGKEYLLHNLNKLTKQFTNSKLLYHLTLFCDFYYKNEEEINKSTNFIKTNKLYFEIEKNYFKERFKEMYNSIIDIINNYYNTDVSKENDNLIIKLIHILQNIYGNKY
jgi:hypothetical protein